MKRDTMSTVVKYQPSVKFLDFGNQQISSVWDELSVSKPSCSHLEPENVKAL